MERNKMKLTNKERTFIAHALDHLKNNTIDDVEYGGQKDAR
jgi:hypothetical protein